MAIDFQQASTIVGIEPDSQRPLGSQRPQDAQQAAPQRPESEPENEARIGVYPGSFNPLTSAHVAIAAAARESHRLDRVELTVSMSALAKQHVSHPRFDHRIEVLTEAVASVPWLGLRVTELQLLADIASGYVVLIVGADKWLQIQDPVWYDDDPLARDQALASLPTVAIAPRDGMATPSEKTLQVDQQLTAGISSTMARDGNTHLMVPAARSFAERTGAWVDPDRYERWLDQQSEQ